MSSNSSKGIVDRVIAWLRNFFDQGARQLDRGGPRRASTPDGDHDAVDRNAAIGEGQRDAQNAARSGTATGQSATATTSTERSATGTPAPSGESLPDLDATESNYEYTGEPGGATRPPEQAGTGGPASEAAEQIEQARSERSDLDEAPGEVDEAAFTLPASGDPNEAYQVHDAVGGTADDAGTDGRIDTERDQDMAPQHGNGDTLLGSDLGGVSPQEEQTAAGGASADEFAHGGYEPVHAEPEEVEAASESEPSTIEDDTATSHLGDLDQHADGEAEPQQERNFNYGAGHLGVDHAPGSDRGTMGEQGPAGSDQTAPVGAEAEAAGRGDAFAQGDEAVTAPGQSGPDAFGDAATGTTEPSRSATGNDLEEGPDALGTTLNYTEESSETFDPDAANLSDEEEMTVSDLEAGEQPGSISGEDSTRVTTFQSGIVAEEQLGGHTGTQDEVDTPEHPYAGIDDEPDVQPSEQESDLDDFSGSDYPSDHRVDRLAGDDPFDAQQPDIGQEGSSAGDLSSTAPADDLLISEVSPPEADDPGVSEGTAVDVDIVSATDDSVGNEPSSTELTTGAVEGMAFADEDAPGADDTGSATTLQDAAAEDTQATPQAIADDGGAGSASIQDGGIPAGALRGDGTTDTPEGYPVKGNASSMIYHLPGYPSYASTKAEFCFATEDDAIAAGYRAPGKRNRGRKE